MAIHFWCLVAAWVVVYLSKLPVAVAMQRAGGYDNHHPRAQQAALEGFGARAVAAHLNGFESFAPFAAAVLVAHVSAAPASIVDTLAIVFVLARLAYVSCYLADLATREGALDFEGAELDHYLVITPDGRLSVRAVLGSDIRDAVADGNVRRSGNLKQVLLRFMQVYTARAA